MLRLAISLPIAILTGIGLELGIYAISGRREAWDSPVFWTVGLPVALIIALGIGLLSDRRAWLATIAIAPSQLATMMVRSGEVGNLWPLALILSSLLSAPFVATAFAG